MDVIDQLGSVSEGTLSRRAFAKSLFAAGVALATMPVTQRQAFASTNDHTSYYTAVGYDHPELFRPYIEKYGKLPNFKIFQDDDEALSRLGAGFAPDVTHPCLSDVESWSSTGLFQPIDTSRLSNWPDVFPDLYNSEFNMVDGKPWLAPCSWGQTSIVYREDLVDWKDGETWDLMFDERYKGRLGSMSSAEDVWWCAAIYAGVPHNDLGKPEAFAKVAAALREQRSLAHAFGNNAAATDEGLISGEIVAAVLKNNSLLSLRAAGAPVRFAKPKEGAPTFVCGPMLHKDARDLDSAYDIIDSLISAPSGEFLINQYGYGAVNKKSYDKFDDFALADRGLVRDPFTAMKAGQLNSPRTSEWEATANSELERIIAGL